jgi:hypothetical protein
VSFKRGPNHHADYSRIFKRLILKGGLEQLHLLVGFHFADFLLRLHEARTVASAYGAHRLGISSSRLTRFFASPSLLYDSKGRRQARVFHPERAAPGYGILDLVEQGPTMHLVETGDDLMWSFSKKPGAPGLT